jgi:predicted metal-dependent HD superfamily phosphohydrolase
MIAIFYDTQLQDNEAAGSSKTSVPVSQTTRCHIQEYYNHSTHNYQDKGEVAPVVN